LSFFHFEPWLHVRPSNCCVTASDKNVWRHSEVSKLHVGLLMVVTEITVVNSFAFFPPCKHPIFLNLPFMCFNSSREQLSSRWLVYYCHIILFVIFTPRARNHLFTFRFFSFGNTSNSEILWRLSRAARDLALKTPDISGDEKKNLVYEAFEMAKKALDANENSYAPHKWYAITLGDVGDYEGTKVKISNAFVIRDHLQVRVRALGRMSSARFMGVGRGYPLDFEILYVLINISNF